MQPIARSELVEGPKPWEVKQIEPSTEGVKKTRAPGPFGQPTSIILVDDLTAV